MDGFGCGIFVPIGTEGEGEGAIIDVGRIGTTGLTPMAAIGSMPKP